MAHRSDQDRHREKHINVPRFFVEHPAGFLDAPRWRPRLGLVWVPFHANNEKILSIPVRVGCGRVFMARATASASGAICLPRPI